MAQACEEIIKHFARHRDLALCYADIAGAAAAIIKSDLGLESEKLQKHPWLTDTAPPSGLEVWRFSLT